VSQLASGLLVIAFAAAMMGMGQLYIEKRSAKFHVFPPAQAKVTPWASVVRDDCLRKSARGRAGRLYRLPR
jgi:hypothetical protein